MFAGVPGVLRYLDIRWNGLSIGHFFVGFDNFLNLLSELVGFD